MSRGEGGAVLDGKVDEEDTTASSSSVSLSLVNRGHDDDG